MSPAYADEFGSKAFDTPDGTHTLAKRWTHPDGPRPFLPWCSPRAVVAGVPGTKKHRCLLVNVGDALVVHNFNPGEERVGSARDGLGDAGLMPSHPPIRVLTFPGTTVTAVAHREIDDACATGAGAPDVLIGLGNGEVLCVSLRALIADRDGKSLPSGTRRFNTDGGGGIGASARVARDVLSGDEGSGNGANPSKTAARCTSVAWFEPKRSLQTLSSEDGEASDPSLRLSDLFLSTHADGNAYVYSAALGDGVDPRFAELRGSNAAEAVSLTPALGVLGGKYAGEPEKTPNPFARMRVGPAALTAAAVAPGGEAVALAGADGRVCVLDVRRVARGDVFLVDGFKSHFGGVDALAWAEGPRDDDDDDDDDDDGDGASETTPNALLGRFRADVCADSPATPRFLLAGGEADVVEVWDRSRRALAARARGHASWVAHVTETPPGGDRTSDCLDSRSVASRDGVDRDARVDHRYDDLLADADAPRRLRFASAGQDCRVCFWELDVDPAPAWWVPALEAVRTPRSADADAPGAKTSAREDAKEVVSAAAAARVRDERDESDEAPPVVPPRAPLGCAPEAARGAAPAPDPTDASAPPAPVVPSSGLASSLMFPTLREESNGSKGSNLAAFRGEPDAKAKALPPAVSRGDVFGDGRLVAPAASSGSTPLIAAASSHVLHGEPCTGLAFVDEGILTSCGGGSSSCGAERGDARSPRRFRRRLSVHALPSLFLFFFDRARKGGRVRDRGRSPVRSKRSKGLFDFGEKSALADSRLESLARNRQQVRGSASGISLYSPRRAAAREAPPKRWCSVSLTAAGAYRVRATPRGRCARAPRSASGPARKALPRRVVARCRARARRSAPRATGRRADPPRASAPCFRGTRCRPSPRSAPRRARGRRLRRVARASMRASSPFRVFALRCFFRGLRRRASPPSLTSVPDLLAGTRTRPGRTRCASSASPAAL